MKQHVLVALAVPPLLLLAPMTAARAQGAQLPPGVFMGEPDYRQAPAGTYSLDKDHASVIARVSHLRYSWSVFRFDRVGGTLEWDPANVAGSSVTAKVETASIATNVKGFAEQLSGDDFLKSAKFPEATFASTAFRRTGPQNGKVDGTLTLMGKTRPVTFEVELVGAGKGFADRPRIGMSGRTTINPVDFGLAPMLGDAIEIVVDAEFERNP
ncbi:MAG: YceI family protein [Pseudomonadota bacterium]